MDRNSCKAAPEKDLIARLQTADPQAFGQLFDAYKRPLFVFIQRFIKSESEAEEVLHDVFMKVWQNRAQIDAERGLTGYLHTLAKHQVLNLLKQKATTRRLNQHWLIDQETAHNPVEEQYIAAEHEQLARQAITLLPPRRREVYQLCYAEEKSYEEVGQLLGISRNAVKDHMVHARRFVLDFFRRYTYLSFAGGLWLSHKILFFFAVELP